ncbi:MAG TPA: DUF5985 family protein [Gemmatimonadaceae bacterium]
MNRFLLGTLAAFSGAIALFFLKFLRESRDRLYGFFSAAFGVLTFDWVARAALTPRHESQHYLFLIRLLAFLLIIAGIAAKNRQRR